MKKTTHDTQKTVLCVDDEDSILAALRRVLTPLGHCVLTASDGMQGVRTAQVEHPDLILLDLMMPDMDGFAVCKRLREVGLSDIPVVMLTGKDSGQDVISGYQEGAVYYITKPFRNEYVANVVKYLIGDLDDKEREWLEQKL
ncbi:MAG: hypothetical protein AMS16_04245 [Planctomycetes bacterium DG_58]|nr:MAG: hypothetical protein AMS16_04245 [Planctomycetes bacterium DG_58]KPL00203.1 MAG: hypothetical protein AMK75_05755 [Planctomycetes bacterium SM23_65]